MKRKFLGIALTLSLVMLLLPSAAFNASAETEDLVSAPIASVLSGVVRENTEVILFTSTPNATIYYTTDGMEPTQSSTQYTAPIKISNTTTIKAISVKSGMQNSSVSTFTYTLVDPELPFINVVTDSFAKKGDTVTVSVNISENSNFAGGSFNLVFDNTAVEFLSANVGNMISTCNPQLNQQYAPNKIRLVWAGMNEINTGGELLNAQFKILENSGDFVTFSLEKPKIADGDAIKIDLQSQDGVILINSSSSAETENLVSAPVASVLSGVVRENTEVILFTSTPNATIYYTTDGMEPTQSSTQYTAPIKISNAITIKAISVKSGMQNSSVSTFTYTLADPELPFINVVTDSFAKKGDTVTVSVNISENSNFAGGSFNLVFDNTAVEFLSANVGNMISTYNPQLNQQYAPNKIRLVWAGMNEIDTGGELLNAQFKILENSGNFVTFSLEKPKIADGDAVKIELQSQDGVILIKNNPSTPTIEVLDIQVSDNTTCNIFITSPEEIIGRVIVGIYDVDGSLMEVKIYDAKPNIDVNMSRTTGSFLKVMWWENFDTMRPIANCVEKKLK